MNNVSSSEPSDPEERSAEAARYALTRRLLPVLRHHMVVHLQPIGMIYEVLDRKLVTGLADLAPIREGLGKINTLARSAIDSCLDVVTWLAPDTDASIALGTGVNECLELLASNFRFRGFTTSNQVGEVQLPVSRSDLREVLTSALMAATDGSSGPLELVLRAEVTADKAVVMIETRPGEGTGFTTEMAYRALNWNDVQALVGSHAVGLEREASVVRLTFATKSDTSASGSAS